ncbi:MAG: ABC transporter permease [Gammaproteobacteria bacterium]
MTYFGLVWANLFRRRTRTVLTLLSLVTAFVLFVLLRAIAGSFDQGGFGMVGIDRLVTGPKYSLTDNLPLSQKQQILGVDGVKAVTQQHWFGGIYQDPKNFFAKFPVVPREYFAIYSEYVIDPEVLEAFASRRTATVVEAGLAETYGWKVGDVIPIQADIWPKVTDYGKDTVGRWTVLLTDPERAEDVAVTIDKLFENSPNPTLTVTEDEASRQFVSQLGDIGFIVSVIMAAVFFTIMLLTGNTMTQALRERVPELAVLKTLGFTDAKVSVIVLAEAVMLCLVGGALGVLLAFGVVRMVGPLLQGFIGSFDITGQTVLLAVMTAIVLGLVIGGIPAWTARRLAIVDALRER